LLERTPGGARAASPISRANRSVTGSIMPGRDHGATQRTGETTMNQADTAWMLISTALVLLMTPALAFFYGGLVRSKHVLNAMMMSFVSLGVIGVVWAVVGYSLAFAPGSSLVGGTSRLFLQ